MAFASNFGRILSPTFQPNSQAKKAGGWYVDGIENGHAVIADPWTGTIAWLDDVYWGGHSLRLIFTEERMRQEVRRGRKFVEYHLGIGWGGIVGEVSVWL